ncbi:ABC transporter substrate-binding protein [Limnochorda pilosa]|uniref:ABC transporter substrate-binding protein n=1 Tax=Limnochorda pilosa TaxID=1555112 RepID=UPI0018E0C05C|nr:ABC transporter substrate-binding protein [Limnochorda pilosa]
MLALVVSFAAVSDVQAAGSRVVLAVGGAECLCYLPTVLAHQLGFFADEGVDVELQNLKGGSKALEALVGGSADVVSGYYDHTITMQAKGRRLVSFVAFDQYPGLVLVVSPHAAERIRAVRDLEGAVVGVTAPGSSTHTFLNFLLAQDGLSGTDVSVVGIGLAATAIAAVERGRVDAAVMLDPAVTLLQRKGGIRILSDTRSEADTVAVYGGPYPAGVLYTTPEWLKANGQTARAMARAMVRVLAWIQDHSAEEIMARMPREFYENDPDLYLAALKNSLPMYSPDGVMDARGPQNALKTLALSDPAVAQAAIRLEATYTNDFITP